MAEIGTFTYGGSGTPDDFQDVEPNPRQTSLYWPATGIRTATWTATAAWRSLRTASGPCWIAPAGMDAMMDYGELIPSQEEGSWFARSTMLDDVEYNVTVADENILYWGGEYDCYIRSQG